MKKKYFDVVMEFIWLAVLFSLPLLFFPNVFTTFELAKVTVFHFGVMLLILMWFTKYLVSSEKIAVFDWKNHRFIWIALMGFIGFYLLATLFSVAPAMSVFGWYPRFQGLSMFFYYLVFGAVLFFEVRSNGQKERLVQVLLLSFITTCAAALLQKFLPGFLQWWNDAGFFGRAYGTMANPDYLAGYIVLLLPIAFIYLFHRHEKRDVLKKIFSVLALAVGFITLAFTASRAGIIASALSFIFLLVIVAVSRKAKKTLVFLGLFTLLFLSTGTFLVTYQNGGLLKNIPVLDRFGMTAESSSSFQTRLEIWPATLRLIATSPFVGLGPETFAVTFPNFAPPDINTDENTGEIVDHAHNELLDWAAQIGVPGAIAYLCFVFGLLGAGTKGFATDGEHKSFDQWLLLGSSASLLGLFIANEFGFSVTVNFVIFTVLSALILNTVHQKDFKETQLPKIHPAWSAFIMIILTVCSCGLFLLQDYNTVLADYHFRQGYDAINGGYLSDAINSYGFIPQIKQALAEITAELRTAMNLAPVQAFYPLHMAEFQLQWLYSGEKLSAVQETEIYQAALQAARLRGYDSFSVSVAQQIKKMLF